jgi:predicted RNA-binding protein with RPS1 domain
MFRPLALALALALCAESAAAFQSPAPSASRLAASRVAYSAAVQPCRFSSLVMCDAPAEEAAPAAAEAEAPPARAPRAAKTPLEELEVGAEVEGKIRSVMAYGAFVDIGAATDALLHVSEISNEFVKDATEILTAGETVKGRIKAINLEKQQLALSCKDPSAARPARAPRVKVDLTKYESADVKEFVTGKVNSITDFGAFVTLEEGVDGLVHISQVQEGGVGKVSDVLTIGQEVQVRVAQVDKSKRRIGLSMLPWSEESEKKGRRGGGGGNWDVGFGEADKEFQMNAEELEALAVGEFTSSPFEAAFARADEVAEKKKKKEKFAAQVL